MWAAGTVRIVVEAGRFDRQDCIVSTEISKLKIKKDTRVALFEQIGKEQKPVKCQLIQEKGGIPVLYWVLDGVTSAGTIREFVARLVRTDAGEETMRVEDTGKGLISPYSYKKGGNADWLSSFFGIPEQKIICTFSKKIRRTP